MALDDRYANKFAPLDSTAIYPKPGHKLLYTHMTGEMKCPRWRSGARAVRRPRLDDKVAALGPLLESIQARRIFDKGVQDCELMDCTGPPNKS